MTSLVLMLMAAADVEMAFPKDYREWVFMSSGLGMTYGPAAAMGQGNPMWDNVFVNPEAWREFKKTGAWPDGTKFVLEIRYATSQGSINKAGHYQTDVAAIELAAKSGNEWQYYNFGNSMRGLRDKVAPLPKTAGCVACHSANGAVEWTFTQFYPAALEIAKQKGTVKTSYQPPVESPVALFHRIREGGWSAAHPALVAARQKDPSASIASERQLNGLAYNLMSADRMKDAIELFRYVTREFPQSANAQDSLAEALEKSGDKPGAVAASRKALELAGSDERIAKPARERIARLSN